MRKPKIEILEIREAPLKDSWNPCYVLVYSNEQIQFGSELERYLLEHLPARLDVYFRLKYGIGGPTDLRISAFNPTDFNQESVKRILQQEEPIDPNFRLFVATAENLPDTFVTLHITIS